MSASLVLLSYSNSLICSSFWVFLQQSDSEFTADDAMLLFGADKDVDELFDKLDLDKDGQVSCLYAVNGLRLKGSILR